MVHRFLSAFSLFALTVFGSSLAQESNEFSKRDVATGDSRCSRNMCIAAVLNGSTVQYTMSGTGKHTIGWIGMGFGTQMANTPMVIMWGNSDGTVTLSQRQATGEVMPTVVSSPARVATISETLSTTSGNSAFVYTIPANNDTTQSLIFAWGTKNPGSTDPSADFAEHVDYGILTLDLTKSLSGSDSSTGATPDVPLTSYQRILIAHGILCVVGFALLLPLGVLLARYLRTFNPRWYTGHWIAQFGIAGPTIAIGVGLGFKSSGSIMDPHKELGIIIFVLYCVQCIVGALIHYVKPKNSTGRPPQNYFHAVFGLTIIALSMYQIRTGYETEWEDYTGLAPIPSSVNIVWTVWVIVLPVLYAVGVLLFLRKQYRQEAESWKGRHDVNDSDMNLTMLHPVGGRYYDDPSSPS